MALPTEPPLLSEPVPMTDPNRRFTMELRSKGGSTFRFTSLTFGEVVERMNDAEPYGFTFLSMTEEKTE